MVDVNKDDPTHETVMNGTCSPAADVSISNTSKDGGHDNQGSELHLQVSEHPTLANADNLTSLAHVDISDGKHVPRRIKRYYQAQTNLLTSIDDIQLHLEDYHADDITNRQNVSAQTIAKITFAINFILFIAKMFAAIISGSLSVVSSVLDSAVDLVSGVLLWWSSRAIKHVDYYVYPRGRRKLEPVSIVILAVIMSLASVQVITRAIESIVEFITYDLDCHVHEVIQNETIPYCGTKSELHSLFENCINGATGPIVELPTLIICSITIVTKLIMYIVCRRIKNPTVQALAQDHRNDVVSNTSAVVFGYIGYRYLKYVDSIGAILIALYIIVNWSITAYEQIKLITGYTAQPEVINKLTWVVLKHDRKILYIDDLKAFHFGNNYVVEVDIVLPISMGIQESHDIGETLQMKLEKLDEVERAFVHVDYETGYTHHMSRL